MCRHVGFEVLTAVTVKSTVFWIVKPCISERARRFGETYLIRLQGWRVSKARSLAFRFLLPVFFMGFFSILKEVICSSETSASLRSTRHYSPERSTLLCRHISFFQPYRFGIASCILIPSPQPIKKTNLRGFSPQANYTDRAIAASPRI
jgi:hypothetical protein